MFKRYFGATKDFSKEDPGARQKFQKRPDGNRKKPNQRRQGPRKPRFNEDDDSRGNR